MAVAQAFDLLTEGRAAVLGQVLLDFLRLD
jgi:hypothetical protein